MLPHPGMQFTFQNSKVYFKKHPAGWGEEGDLFAMHPYFFLRLFVLPRF
jgi:hypothetical protein